MSRKDELRAFVTKYGELELLKDLASIFQELGTEWSEFGDKAISYTFSDSANIIADVANRLEVAEQAYSIKNNGATQKELMQKNAETEYTSLIKYFESLSIPDLTTLYEKNKSELMSKLKRLEYLKRLIDKNNDKK